MKKYVALLFLNESFEPVVIPKRKRDVSAIEDKVLAMSFWDMMLTKKRHPWAERSREQKPVDADF